MHTMSTVILNAVKYLELLLGDSNLCYFRIADDTARMRISRFR
jgi:hypothetical protein